MGLFKKLFSTKPPKDETPEQRKKREDEEALMSATISAGSVINGGN